ncbi:MAG: FtsW/RodA/SpoVE family cell cycle protein [Porphyromonas sp.]|nr:FtsW/RodA/SpoVE family cell cycle protein [Porphyromonas sp.]
MSGFTGSTSLPYPEKSKWNIRNLFIGSKTIWAVMLILMSISLWIVFSSTSTKAFGSWNSGGNFFYMFTKHIGSMIFAIGMCVLISHLPLKFLRAYAWLWLSFSCVLLLLVPFIGVELNDAKRQIVLFGFSFQPSELVRLTLINYVAARLRYKDGKHATPSNFWWIFIPSIAICAFIFLDNMSTALILGAVIFYISYIGGANRTWMRRLFIGGLAILVLLVGLVIAVPSLRHGENARLGTGYGRIERFISQVGAPINTETFDDIKGKDLQVVSSQRAIANSHFFGVGFGKSEMRNLLPEPYSDFVFSIIVEEGGILAALIVIMTYLALFFAVGGIAKRTDSVYLTLLSLGIGLIITLQAILHMMICVNIFPITGQNLPFISRGGSSYLITGMYFGILLAISNDIKRRKNRDLAKVAGNNVVEPEAIPEMPEEPSVMVEEGKL